MSELVTLKVARVDDLSKRYVVKYEDKLYRVQMMPEQLGKGNPGEIVCRVQKGKNYNVITQDIETLMRRHYKEGDEVVYTIEKITMSYYYLKDSLGYHTYLERKFQINPIITPQLKCRITSIGSKRVNVELVERISVEQSQFTIGAEYVESLFVEIPDNAKSITHLLLSDNGMDSFDSECHKWIQGIASERNTTKDEFEHIRQVCLNVLETSELLRRCTAKERTVLEGRFTILIEQLGYYLLALASVEEGKDEETIGGLLTRLQNTGYLYHPRKMFYVMMCIFLIRTREDENSAFLGSFMPKVFDTLRSNDIDNWKRKPFKVIWIKLLELYITTMSKNQETLLTDREALRNMLQALALQFNLMDDSDEELIDSELNLSLLYRYCSRIGVLEPLRLLDMAYNTLIGAIHEKPKMINYTSDPDRMANVVSNLVNEFEPDNISLMRYEGEVADILVGNELVRIVPKEYSDEDCYDNLPEYLNLWNNIQISVPYKALPIAQAKRQALPPYKQLWNDIYLHLLTPSKVEKSSSIDTLMMDEQVSIIITGQTSAETPTFECMVVDSKYFGVKGTIRMADMVGYATPTVGLFSFEKGGHPYKLEAYVTAINPDGTYRFEMTDNINDFSEDYRSRKINYTDTFRCVVTAGTTLTPGFYAVSEHGLSVSVIYDKDTKHIPMSKGTVIEVTEAEGSRPGFMTARFVGIAPDNNITLADAFGNLMRLYSGDDVFVEKEESKDESVPVDTIETAKVREIMHIIDNVASLENDYIKAYNYLCYCKLIAHILGDVKQESYYGSKTSLIELLYEFDVNNHLSEEQIAGFEMKNAEFFSSHSSLYQQFRKLQMVSFLGNSEHDKELAQVALSQSAPDLAQLAQLVLSYNFMLNTQMMSQASDVHEHIKELLQLQRRENPKKNYGMETFTKEFKSSIVCPPDSTTPDLPRQTHKILEEICAFLNAEGGTLYIGVDDKTHLEKGIEDDLRHPQFDGSRDKFDLYVRNKINQKLGELADHCIHSHFDDEAHKAVYVIEIAPCPKPVSLDDVFYERRGTSSRHVSEDYLPTFIANRMKEVASLDTQRINQLIDESRATTSVEEEEQQEQNISAPYEYSTDFEEIKTSQARLRRHLDDDISENELSTFVNIFEDNTYSITDQKLSDCLSIGIYDEEQTGYLVVVYATGEMSKIPIAELLDRELWISNSINNKSRIVFVSPAMPDDILSILYHSKNNDYYRFFTVDNIERGTFNTSSRPFYTDGPIDEILECEVGHFDKVSQFKNFLDIDNDKPGADSKKTDGKRASSALRELLGQ